VGKPAPEVTPAEQDPWVGVPWATHGGAVRALVVLCQEEARGLVVLWVALFLGLLLAVVLCLEALGAAVPSRAHLGALKWGGLSLGERPGEGSPCPVVLGGASLGDPWLREELLGGEALDQEGPLEGAALGHWGDHGQGVHRAVVDLEGVRGGVPLWVEVPWEQLPEVVHL